MGSPRSKPAGKRRAIWLGGWVNLWVVLAERRRRWGSNLMVVGWALGWLDDCRLQKVGMRVGLVWFVPNRGLDVL